ncbi:transcription factor MYB3R-1 isoform X2 [Ricinus communis]|uniref:transcription factor MYB3R-1 isoform X2 n=1 Tax=Ricinus communis TaxID=3988 RepID=UPI000772B8FA|nr:transcription factor MYB3R-1 isoform X2 [Ricinus communis]|eukprot:XP_015573142.1 transcription factor MYB3R-1 isoform X2 [Ricinus communis]
MESDKSITAPSDGHGEGVGIQRIRPLHGRTSGPARRSTKGQWTAEEDEILRKAVQRFKGKNWKKIAECFKDRTDVQCLHRWQKVLNPELVKGPWSKEEDETIIELVNKYGPKKWSTIAQHLPGRIGKQCRERWHNHLNPSINKEAWTQQEELALIRAHQIYGNRWAELTKFLPGRTDNSIKNHWNSSVKKKLDSYLASGLLEQFQGLPLVPHQPMPSSSSRVQSSGDDSGFKCGIDAEEISECSQESIVAGCSQSMSGLGNAVLPSREEFHLTEESGLKKERSSSPASCSEQYFTSVGDVTFSVPEIPCEMACSSNFLHQNFSSNTITPASNDYQYNIQELPSVSSLELGHDSSGLPTHCMTPNESHDMVNVPFQSSMGFSVPAAMGNITENSAKPDHMFITDDECCQFLFSEAMNGAIFSGNFMKGSNSIANIDSSSYQSINNQIPETEKVSQPVNSSKSALLVTSCSRSLPAGHSLLSADDTSIRCDRAPNQLTGHTFAAHEQEYITSANDGFIYTNGTVSSPYDDGTENTNMQEQHYLKEPSKLVPVNTFTASNDTGKSCPVDEINAQTEQQDAGALCYEPPRFPSLDIPFLSCELIQSSNDIQQEYSPLGIRQLMMSSMNCITPFRLWDSPSRDDSPNAVLKTAAKTFTTPSILKKRNRDLLSPLSDRRLDKKLEIDMTSSLTKEFSRLDVMLDENETHKTSVLSPSSSHKKNEDKENMDPALEVGQEKGRDCSTFTDHKMSEKDCGSSDTQDSTKHGTVDDDAKTKPSGVHVEDSMNDLLFFSPEVGLKSDRAFGPSSRTPKNFCRRILGTLSEHGIASESSSGNSCFVVSSPTISKKNHESHLVASTSVQSSVPSENAVDNAGNDAGTENLSIFGETPFKRSIESPSAWKSPWFINSFLPGPRVDTDISIEDIGYFMSPGDRSYDAIALMKQLSEHTASAFADALEVLGNETPETILEKRRSSIQNMNQENNGATNSEPENHSHLASNISTECRTLDFSECGTPGKGTERGKSSTAIIFSSPSSYLLKGCR